MSIESILDAVAAILLIAGTALMALGALGLLRMPDLYTRAQASAKSGTLGLAIVFLAVALHFHTISTTSEALAVIAFAFLSVPVAAHMITRATHAAGTDIWPAGSHDELRDEQHWPDTTDPTRRADRS